MGLIDFSLKDAGGILTSVREAITGEKIKDPAEMAKIAIKLQEVENALLVGQISTNIEEAKHPNWLVAGWRPFVGWMAGLSFGLAFIPKAIVLTAMWTYQAVLILNNAPATEIEHLKVMVAGLPVFPDLGIGDVIALLGSMLGLAGLRTYERIKGANETKGFSK